MQNYEELIQELISSHQAVGSKMSLKIHSLYFDLDFFPRAAEGFHQDGLVERSYDKWSEALFADFSWSVDKHHQKNTK
jgi:hypothetical protein